MDMILMKHCHIVRVVIEKLIIKQEEKVDVI